ncbi:hypothetical protein GCM10023081_15130 [Arthrobacter ginkgonis]|uniref:Uncharacterized protein n=1 Tax=Arthrobacter ginkgonis TaxID=1630594 RepID=A0ABP7C691_9MICC
MAPESGREGRCAMKTLLRNLWEALSEPAPIGMGAVLGGACDPGELARFQEELRRNRTDA